MASRWASTQGGVDAPAISVPSNSLTIAAMAFERRSRLG
jgi:hypothetical protein